MNWNSILLENYARRGRIIAAILTASLLPLAVTAQEAEEEIEEEDDIIILSPFVVDETATVGYLATQTLAGTRIASQLKDVAASVFVFTPELMEDTGMTNIQDAFMYGANTEGRDTYTAAARSFTGRSDAVGAYSSSHSNIQANQRVRGLTSADVSRGYYFSTFPMDTFSIEQATLLRGPNSIMFGLGSPAGIFDYTPKRAKFRDTGEFSFRFNKYGGARYVLDYNKHLLEDELAIRVVGLSEDERFDAEPAFEKDKRLFITGSWKPFKGRTGTTIRATAEFTDMKQLYPADVPPTDGYSKWLDAGGEGWDPTLNRTLPFQPRTVPYKEDEDEVEDPNRCPAMKLRDNDGYVIREIPYPVVDGVCRNLNGDPFQVGFPPSLGVGRGNIRGIVLADNKCGAPRSEADPACDLVWASTAPRNAGAGVSVNGVATRQGFTGTAGTFDGVRFEVEESITDRSVWDWKNWNIAVNRDSISYFSGSTWNLTVEQKLFDNFHIEAGVNQERYSKAQNSPFRQGKIHIDPNLVLPDGSPNPNYRRPVMSYSAIGKVFDEQADEYRLTATYTLDLEEKISKWFGRHKFIGHYNNLETNIREHSTRDVRAAERPNFYDGPLGRSWDLGPRGSFPVLHYIGPPVTGNQVSASGPFLFDFAFYGGAEGPSGVYRTQQNANYFLNSTVDDAYAGAEGIMQPPGTQLFAPGSTDRGTGSAYCVRDRSNPDYRANCVPVLQMEAKLGDDGMPALDEDGNTIMVLSMTPKLDMDGKPVMGEDGMVVMTTVPTFDDMGNALYQQMAGGDFIHSGKWHSDGVMDATSEAFWDITRGLQRNTFESAAFISQSHMFRKGADSDDHFAVFTLGWRRDKVNSWEGAEIANQRNAANIPDTTIDGWVLNSQPLGAELVEDSFSYGIVAHPTKWLSLYYNDSKNFRSQGLRVTLYGDDIGPERGTGTDKGFNLSLFKGKLNARVNWFEVEQGNVSAQAVHFIAFWRLNYMESQTKLRLVDQGYLLPVDRSSEYVPSPQGYPGRVGSLGTVSNFSASGNEIEITANTRIGGGTLRMMFNAGRQEVVQSNLGPFVKQWIEERTAAWSTQPWYSRKGKEGTGPFGTGLDFEKGAITFNPADDETCAIGQRCTFEELLQSIVLDPLNQVLVQDGRVNPQLSEWHWATVANYTFDQGFLDGFSIGGAMRWNAEQVIGYNVTKVTIDGQEVDSSDLDSPYYGDSDLFTDIWFGYRRQLFEGKLNWKIQLNVRNFGNDADLDEVATHLDGSYARYRIVPESSWFITNTFDF